MNVKYLTLVGLCVVASLAGCADDSNDDNVAAPAEVIDFESAEALEVRLRACSRNYDNAARKGAGAEDTNASTIWSVSPYLVLVPSTGEGYVQLNVDAPHFNWLLYTTSDMRLESLGGPEIIYNGPVEECPGLDLVEYGVHHDQLATWPLLIHGEPRSRALFYSGLVPTEHSDPNFAGHAGHDLNGDEHVEDGQH